MDILATIVLLAAICNFILGFFVFSRDPSKEINRIFGIFSFITAAWVFTNFMAGAQHTIFWLKSTSALGSLVPIFAALWISEMCDRKTTKRETSLFLGLGLFFFAISYVNNLIVTNVKNVYLGGFEGETGPFFISYLIYIFTILTFIIYTLISGYYRAEGIRKTQISYVITGTILYTTIVLIVSFILPLFGDLKFTALDSPASLFLMIFTTLAITRYHLFEIKIILTETLVGAIGLILLIQAITAETIGLKIFGFFLLILFGIVGYFLIKGVLREIYLRTELQKAYQELKRLDEAKSEFVSIASHQLRTPLAAIKGYISMILEKTYGEVPEKIIKPLRNVSISNERLIKLVNDLLNISRIESGKIEMNWKKCSMGEIIASVVEELKNLAEQKNLYLKLERSQEEKSLLEISIDQDKIRQAIMNLIDNAIRYTGKGGVTIKLKTEDSKLKIAVCDTGEGMTKEEISNLFESFSRGTAGTRSWTEGAGLGLYVAKRFVEMHKGKIWAESPGKGKGSTFYIELPLV